METEPTTQPHESTARPEPYQRLPALGAKNGFTARQMYAFARDGLQVVKPLGRRLIYSRQSWLEAFLAERVLDRSMGRSS